MLCGISGVSSGTPQPPFSGCIPQPGAAELQNHIRSIPRRDAKLGVKPEGFNQGSFKKNTHRNQTKQHENACVFAGSAGSHLLLLLLPGLVLERCWTCMGKKKKSIAGVSPALLRAVVHFFRASELLDGAGPEMPTSSRSQEKALQLRLWCCRQNCIPQVLGGERRARQALLEPRLGKHGSLVPLVYPGGCRGLFRGAGGAFPWGAMLAASWQPDGIDSGSSEGAPRGLFWL